MAFPTDKPTFPVPTATSPANSPSVSAMANQLATNLSGVIDKVGIDGTADTTTLDYKLTNASSSNPGHKHTLADGATDITASVAELNYVDGVTSAIQTQLNAKEPTITTLTVAKGGTGADTLTGILKGNGTSAVTAVTAPSGTIVGTTDTQTLTNKRVNRRILTATSYTTDTGTSLNCDTLDEFIVTAQAGALKLNNPTGTPVDGQMLMVAVTGTGARALTYDTQFEASTVALPTTTVTTARLNMLFTWADARTKWVILAAV